MRVAVIDLGTNTFNLLVAYVSPVGFEILHNSKEGVALGMGGINEGIISEAATQRAFAAFEQFKTICDEHQVTKILGIGTSAIRDASNGKTFVETLKVRFGIDVEIIDGLKEAELIYQGVSWSHDFTTSSIIMDIGGGSTEFIRVEPGKEMQSCSLNIGVSRAVQLFDLSDPISKDDQQKLIDWFEEQAQGIQHFEACEVLVGASGSFETFYEMVHESPFPSGIETIHLNRTELDSTLEWIIASTHAEREAHPFIIPIRRKMAPIAALKTKWVLEKFNIQEVVISPCSLKEGVLKSFIR